MSTTRFLRFFGNISRLTILGTRDGPIHDFAERRPGKTINELIRKKGYQNRSEAVRDMLRNELESARLEREESPYCVASLTYVYNHHARDLTERLTKLQHEHH